MKQISIRNSIKPMQDSNFVTIWRTMSMEVLDDVEDIFIDPVYDLMNVIHKEFVKIAKFGFEYSEEILNFEYENS